MATIKQIPMGNADNPEYELSRAEFSSGLRRVMGYGALGGVILGALYSAPGARIVRMGLWTGAIAGAAYAISSPCKSRVRQARVIP